jgi:Domain of unknown function (DUF4034)
VTRIAFKIGILALLVLAWSGLGSAAEQHANSNPCNISETDAAGLNGDLSGDIHAFHNFTDTTSRILKEEKFVELDCLADHARSGKERLPGGLWKIHLLYQGLRYPVLYPVHATQEDWTDLLQRLQRWVKARPESITARVALALVYLGYASDARGTGYAKTVSESGWKLFGERTAEAQRILKEASKLAGKCPEWYVAMQMVSVNQGWSVADARALFEEANKFEPEYYTYARDLAYYLLPKWSGKAGDTEKFLLEVADRIGGDKGDILYFQVASANYVICGCDDNPDLSWDRIKRGFEASEKHYGVSMENLNRIAYLASYFGERDPVYADKILARIGNQWDAETWGSQETFEKMKQWVSVVAPAAAQVGVIEETAAANEKTPEGVRYKAAFEKTYRELVQQCVRSDGGSVTQWQGKFKTLTNLGSKGTVEDIRIQSMGPVVTCLGQKLYSFKQENATPFSPPPQAPYWIELHLDWADFAPIQPNDSSNQSIQRFPLLIPRGNFVKVAVGSALILSLGVAYRFLGREQRSSAD